MNVLPIAVAGQSSQRCGAPIIRLPSASKAESPKELGGNEALADRASSA